MQFLIDGFRTGDPRVQPAAPGRDQPARPITDVERVDVLIVGTGPAGLVLAAQLSQFPAINTRIVERRCGPLERGQADGVACRTVEMLQAFELADKLLAESYWVNETAFWRPDPANPGTIIREGRIQDVEDGLSEFPHVIVNQARLQQLLLDYMARSASRLVPDYGVELLDLSIDDAEPDYPVTARLRSGDDTPTVRAKYAVGCDGARSAVRESLGVELRGDATNTAWGVLDVLATTDFPDYRLKAVISSEAGSILLIPREGGYLGRIYVELDAADAEGYASVRDIPRERLVDAVNRTLHPYTLDVKQFAWSSIYEVGQRLTDRFDNLQADADPHEVPRVFIAGDACHTHSAKAGQGMNVSLQDGFNLGWKLAAVLDGRSDPHLLRTYSQERQAVAQDLIDFDREWNEVMHSDPERFQQLFGKQGRYTAGLATRYDATTPLTGRGEHQGLADGFSVGMRFHSGPVVRVADAKAMELGHAALADGAWRLYAFADRSDINDPGSGLARLVDFLANDEASPIKRHTPPDRNIDSVIDLRAIVQQYHRDVDVTQVPSLLRPAKGALGLTDYEKLFSPNLKAPHPDIFDLRGIDRDRGALVIVRPDQYVAEVLPLDAYAELSDFFAGVFGRSISVSLTP